MSHYSGTQTLQADVLLVTVTALETVAVRRLFSVVQRHFIGNRTYYDLGEVGGAKVFLVRSEMGAGGQGGAILTIQKGIDELSPSAIIMVGIAFGVDPTEQKIGDILVSQQILDYELQRVGIGPDQEVKIISKGDKAAASLRLLNRFRAGEIEWQEAKEPAEVRFGLILSGAKLVDNQDFREQLRAFGPDAVGGEMEGAGLYAAAQSNKVDWILVKAICDWADGNKGVNKEANQELAASNAARFIKYVIEQGGLRSERPYNPPPYAAATPTSRQAQPSQPQSNKQADATGPIDVFISYAQDDEKFKQELEKHLKLLTRQKIIHSVHSESIAPGDSRQQDIANLIDQAQIILLLVSQNFLASDQLYDYEMMHAMKKHDAGAARVIPVILRPADLKGTPFEGLRSLPRDDKPVGSPGNDVAWSKIAEEIRQVCEGLLKGKAKD